LREQVYLFGKKNFRELYRRGEVKGLSQDEFSMLKPPNL
jgi:hypothetical protein